MWPATIELTGQHVTLAPLSFDHLADLQAASASGDMHKLWYTSVPSADGMEAEIARRLGLQEAGSMLPFTVLLPTGRAVGMTTYMNIDAATKRVEIGSTWYAPEVQRSSLNTEAKRLLLSHAFDDLECVAVEFRTHFMNHQSRRAIERLGAKLDGVLRSHTRMADGSLRDTAVYSILSHEWPMVQAHLNWQLEKPRD
ncbi:GNAT family N-acetyltransferase [Thalassovita mediterranea]|jgi:glucosamine--fructose-6-phosphate aminotransferase (isomerizing)|uniref:Putative ribosomal N-acetyltransferase YdaF n=1 Tax=Thalassovita mediterranea TaxID=340021 RepID=A0A0P1GRW5_9RHOB|nr:GNAT family protein [Thalassovita mediterranea]CUH85268.1 Putative ribosomal N-acetyltransferase YdaF [Thalassovita mediterranea]SIS30576.1 glucosamine--fructose-6-phosphate aminotransferase (isomerizing) [Thalassovita mediterranea]